MTSGKENCCLIVSPTIVHVCVTRYCQMLLSYILKHKHSHLRNQLIISFIRLLSSVSRDSTFYVNFTPALLVDATATGTC